MKLEYDTIYDDVAGCVMIPLHDKIYEIMRQYNLQNMRVKVELLGLEISIDENTGKTIETEIPIPHGEDG